MIENGGGIGVYHVCGVIFILELKEAKTIKTEVEKECIIFAICVE